MIPRRTLNLQIFTMLKEEIKRGEMLCTQTLLPLSLGACKRILCSESIQVFLVEDHPIGVEHMG